MLSASDYEPYLRPVKELPEGMTCAFDGRFNEVSTVRFALFGRADLPEHDNMILLGQADSGFDLGDKLVRRGQAEVTLVLPSVQTKGFMDAWEGVLRSVEDFYAEDGHFITPKITMLAKADTPPRAFHQLLRCFVDKRYGVSWDVERLARERSVCGLKPRPDAHTVR